MHFTINNLKVSAFTINKLNVCILRLFEVKNCTPEIKKHSSNK